jgi:3-phenylpropionate/cinnamic acid dioxygenase small subunit
MTTVATANAQKSTAAKIRIGFGDPIYAEIMDFLTTEAALLDHDRHMEWVDLLAQDVSYTIPVRKTVHMRDGPGFDENAGMPANYEGLKFTAERNMRADVFDHDPRHRMRRFITNVQASRTDKDNEFAVDSYILFLKTKYDEPTFDFVSAERRDVLRRTADGMKLVRRRLIYDQTMLSTQLPNIIL